MPQEQLTLLQRLAEYGVFGYLWLLFISLLGGTVKYITSLNGEKPTALGWFFETVTSGFVGIVAAMACQSFEVDFFLTSAITGICAHNGTRSIYLITAAIKKGK